MNNDDRQPDAALLARLSLDDRPGPALRSSKERCLGLVQRALDEAQLSAAPVPTATRSVGSMLAMAATVLLLLAGSAAAARWVFVLRSQQQSLRPPAANAVPLHPAPHLLPRSVPPPVAALPPAPTLPAAAPTPPPSAAERARHEPPRDAEDWMQQANRLRALGRFAEAVTAYAQVFEHRSAGDGVPAYVAAVAAGSIELEHLGHPARARKLFSRALQAMPQGALDIEAREGLALAAADLDDRGGEADALTGLIAAHPGSPAAERARVRLRALAVSAR